MARRLFEIVRKKKMLFLSLGVVAALLSFVGGLFLFSTKSQVGTVVVPSGEVAEHFQIPDSTPNQSTLGVALFGFGGAGHDGGYLTDAIQILYADFEKSKLYLISIPRDLWVSLPSGRQVKINEVVTASADKKNLVATGAQGLKTVLSEITGLPVQYFVGIDFVGFQRAIGLHLKGIEVEVAETLDDPWYPIKGEELNLCGKSPEEMVEIHAKYSGFELERQFECRYKHVLVEKGTVSMLGEEALEYVRSRHGSAEGDISRGKRQQEVLTAIHKKLFAIQALDKLPGFFTEITKATTTDVNLDIVKYLSPVLKKSQDFQVVTINLATTNVLSPSKAQSGAFILVPKAGVGKWDEVRQFIKSQL